jgi:hypothetical protein
MVPTHTTVPLYQAIRNTSQPPNTGFVGINKCSQENGTLPSLDFHLSQSDGSLVIFHYYVVFSMFSTLSSRMFFKKVLFSFCFLVYFLIALGFELSLVLLPLVPPPPHSAFFALVIFQIGFCGFFCPGQILFLILNFFFCAREGTQGLTYVRH